VRDVLRGLPLTDGTAGGDKDAHQQPAPAAGAGAAAGTGGDDWVLPDLYSLRRSPYYQRKITQRQLNAHILNTRTTLITQLTHAAKSEYDLRDCLDKLRQQYARLATVKRQSLSATHEDDQDDLDKRE
jgi:hypothetical protein